ncbi:MAG: HAD-IIIA family hydrolase [Acidobacteriota bacterium]|nr:HAD-IIIA family hydrolase [Acidobacteriota bacterium]
MSRPEQAAILCGGLGTRLRPLTDNLPKPMAPVNGRPFLAYLIQQLREQGIRRIVLMTGYRGDQIREHFGDGGSTGVAISYSHGPAEWETGRRIWEARDLLDPRFMLLYSDNYVPFSLDRLHAFHVERGTIVSLLVQAKARANVLLGERGIVDVYDPARTTAGAAFVEIGYMVAERDRLLALMTGADVSFSATLKRLAEEKALAGFVQADPYHSISDLDRLRETERYLAHKRILLIDRDGTINARAPRAEYVTSWDQFHWVAPTVDAMRQLAAEGFRFIVLSNQAGIARGMQKASEVEALNARMREELARQGIDIVAVYVCPHHWDDGCECRKPSPGMFFQASADHQLRLNRTIYVGDDPRDSIAAYNAGCVGVLVGEDTVVNGDGQPERTADTLPDLVPWLISRFQSWEAVP